ncbi:hypothetical protein BAZOLSSOX_1892 [uncultured Gammaproteobacteria bacterium]|nr:hypothetical protein [uncultured Gammaproteobacteria bacterium]VVH58930.1 hypothetical protein BAZOLSSOX_977 [uncultured Gammaproteobacteria bacterium]VVH61027.1 hypothetical protein BAZOLSSOX_1892 [uncultured Gammaproteobacteria bacterium]
MHQRRYSTSISSGMKIKSVITALKNRAIHLRWATSYQ